MAFLMSSAQRSIRAMWRFLRTKPNTSPPELREPVAGVRLDEFLDGPEDDIVVRREEALAPIGGAEELDILSGEGPAQLALRLRDRGVRGRGTEIQGGSEFFEERQDDEDSRSSCGGASKAGEVAPPAAALTDPPIGSLIPATPCTTACTCACTSERPPRSFPVIARPSAPIRPLPPTSP
jgi:hypothetical protein